jgi:hypothetical protein
MNNYKRLTKCDFCKYKTASGCNAKPDSIYCKEATNEFYVYLNKNKQQTTKSLRPWERKK